MEVFEALSWRRSVPSFDSSVKISDEEVLELLEAANLAPSSMNLQPWEYLVLTSEEDKSRLQSVSFGQKKIGEASAAIVVLGDLEHHLHASDIADSNIALGYLSAEKKDSWVAGAHGAYADNPKRQRDESFRGGSLWAMAFMMAAASKGWDTAPMGGFVPGDLASEFGLPETIIPVIVICIGKRNPEVEVLPRSYRFEAGKIAHFGNYRFKK